MATAGSRCGRHAKERPQRAPDTRESASNRGYDRKWRRIRAMFLKKNPVCEDCGAPATEPHHRIPRAQGGSDRWENLMALCKTCHSRRTASGG